MFGVLFDRWFDRVHDVARNIVRNSETAGDVAQDAFISAWQQLDKLDDPDAFGGWLLRITRNRALDRLQRDQRSRPQEDHVVTRQHDAGAPDPMGTRRRDDPADISSDLERDDLVHAAAVALGVRDASLLDLHVRHGLGAAEIAKETGASANSVHQQLFRMRDRLGNAIGAMLLWQRGKPTCAQLGDLLSDGDPFDAEVFGVVERHRRTCDDCTERRTGMISPEALFAALPIAVVPLTLKAGVAQGISAAGVPLGPGTAPTHVDGSSDGPDGTPDVTSHGAPIGALDGSPIVAAALPISHRYAPRRLLIAAAVLLLVSAGVIGVALSRRSSEQVSGSLADIEGLAGEPDSGPVAVVDSEGPGPTEQGSTALESTTSITALGAPVPSTGAPAAQSQGSTTPPLAPNQTAPSPAPRQQSPPVVAQTTLPPATTQPLVTTQPPATQPPVTTSPPTTTLPPTTTTVPPAAPIVTSFTAKAGPGGLICGSPSQSPRTFEWTTVNAESATLTIAGVGRVVLTNGTYDACGGSGQLAVLKAQSPGGTAQRSLTLA
jgi:RNA polymerase sigma factor (sigma-70 family)